MSTKRNPNEQFREFELRFNSQLSRFNALATFTALADSIFGRILLANVSVVSSQRVFILAAVSRSSNFVDLNDSTDNMLRLVKYETIATVLWQCDSQHNTDVPARTSNASTVLTSAYKDNDYGKPKGRRYNRMTRKKSDPIQEQLANQALWPIRTFVS